MYETQQYDSPPQYSPHYIAPSNMYTSRSFYSQRSEYGLYSSVPDAPQTEGNPQHFYRLFSPPGIVKTMEGLTALLCFVIFVCVASTLVWDMHGYEGSIGAFVAGSGGYGMGSGYYGGTYGYQRSYMTPYSAKSAMISMAALNFVVSLAILVVSFSKTWCVHGKTFYLTVLVVDVVLAILQCIIDIIFVIGVNPMAQSSQSIMYNPILMMCQTSLGTPSISAGVGAGFPGAYPSFNRYLYHYCFMDPEEAVALVCGLFVMIALAVAAYFAYKTRSKIWRHGKPNIYWEEPPILRIDRSQNLLNWRSTQYIPTVVLSEKASPHLKAENSFTSYTEGTVSVYSESAYKSNVDSEDANSCSPEPLYQSRWMSSNTVEEVEVQSSSVQEKPETYEVEDVLCETGYTTGDSATELDTYELDDSHSEITTDDKRRQYKKQFDISLTEYKNLCAEMDDISDQMNELSRELDTLHEESTKFQAVADEYNRLKDLKRSPEYQATKLRCKKLRQELCHIKQLVKNYDRSFARREKTNITDHQDFFV
ncbi:occludin-like [Sinocyclocheilus anshuiensis]|uniref:Occludin n=1 Tax=Sinocyclocheilus anshuiensis TaxID=1608454 RepID=A0A671NSE4_9TELE|nr:PREDICTED: occludin-like [Sinocyclocheilus anshuiensis]